MAVNEFDPTKPATSGTDASADLRNNYLALAQGADLLNVYASTPNDKKVHWKAAIRAYIGATRLNVASGELNMANFNSYIATDGYWARAYICMNLSGEKDVRVGTQAQYSGETGTLIVPSYEIPMASVCFQRNGSSINNIANVNIYDLRPVVMAHDGVSNATNATNATNLTNGISSLIRDEQSAENTSDVTLIATVTTIATLAEMTVVAGDRILISSWALCIKGATAGNIGIVVGKDSGTATVLFGHDNTDMVEIEYVNASTSLKKAVSGILKVTVGGTLILKIAGYSIGSDSSVATGQGQLHALVLKGS